MDQWGESMRAMVMAAGAGTRLRPLTFSVPKPMVPVANRPVMEYTLQNLRKHGITELILNLHSYPEMIRNHFKNGEQWGVQISYSHEPQLLGTAGGVKKVTPFFKNQPFLVMSGDGLTDVDLTRLMTFHRQRRAVGTIGLKPIDTRFEYGVAITDRQGKITRFVEKPLWSDVFSNNVNTGIYMFEPSVLSQIPSGRSYDFGHELWPKLLKNRARIFGYPIKAYWCDVGSLGEYRRAQKDILDGRLEFTPPGRQLRKRIWVGENTTLDRSAVLEGPCLIGNNCRIGAGARIGAYTVIGDNARIGRNVTLRSCTLWNNVRVDDRVTLENCVIGHQTRISGTITVHEGALINA
jgi:mannose-1-phosphate guanylyltransferase/phosphomannomutase